MTLGIKQLDRICLVAVITVSVFCGYLVMNSGTKQKRQARQENELFSKKRTDLNLAEINLQGLNRALDNTKTGFELLNSQIPESAEIGVFLKELGALMKQREITLISVQPLSAVKEALFTRIPIRLMFKGSFINTYQVVHDLETMKRMVVMEKMNIAGSDKGEECRVDLMANIFER